MSIPTLDPAAKPGEDTLTARLVSLVGSRLCHDLVSPLGAIGNGVELLEMAGSYPSLPNSPEMGLIVDALEAARARIRLFRLAFGAAGENQRIAPAEFQSLLDDIEKSGRLKLRHDNQADQARAVVKLVLLALMCLETAMPWGARVVIAQEAGHWTLSAEAERTRRDPALWAWLDNARQASMPQAAEVHFALLGLGAAEQRRRLSWDLSDSGARISF